ncbi:MAG TPA: glucosamine-6-phosphate deaminase [Tepidisphaeraceae bacterium]|jgi:glucosamine-6-phosphate deaminase|nr:glucosamine-6-phosphate deaminase [Tepidisphaeraceae bacterium]
MIGASKSVAPAHGPHALALGVEHIPATVYGSSAQASRAVAHEIAALINLKAARGEKTVLGLATGSTPTGVYDELIRLHEEEGLSFKNVVTFNLDEYWPMDPENLQSYRRFMREHLFDHVDILPQNAHVPDGTVPLEKVAEYCQDYERRIRDAGGLDYQILGIGRTGHVGFNEPGSPRDSRTRLITLDRVTRMDAASDFFGEWNVPRKAITMGVETILSARTVVLLAFGEHKAGVIRRAVEGEISSTVAASYLQQHPSARIVLDTAAASELTRFKTPWLLGSLEMFGQKWDAKTTRTAATWLAMTVKKPLLKLTDEDYNEHGLQELLSHRGSAYDINIEVFKALQNTITGWPGGKPAHPMRHVPNPTHFNPWTSQPLETTGPAPVDDNGAGSAVFPKRVVVFSPHPDDDVISMGGTFIRLCEQGHDVHVAYQTSGNIAVWDDTAVRHADFVAEFSRAFNLGPERADAIEKHVINFIRKKQPGEVDSAELQQIKGLIRRTEARAGARYSGVRPENIHFLDMPFYETGRVRKKPLGEADIKIIMDLLEKVQPHQVYAAGDLSDPHGTHRVCLAAIIESIRRLKDREWMKQCDVWLYRGAWQEWGVHEIEMAVPLSPDEVLRKRIAIFKHESQKDKALFPGPNDPREFWQRAEDRNRHTAELYDKLGLAEYEAIEGYVRWRDDGMHA